MRPAIEVAADVVSHNQPGRVLQGIAVIEADRAEVVAEIVQYLQQLDATRDESNLIGWAAQRVRELEEAAHMAMLELGSHGACPACCNAHSTLRNALTKPETLK